jgi:hypothetical protein
VITDGKEFWFGFSLRLPDPYTLGTVNPQEEIHFQMHGSPNHKLHELWRNPIFALSVLPDKDYDHAGKLLPYSGKVQWQVTARGDPRLNLTQHRWLLLRSGILEGKKKRSRFG